MHKFVHLRTHSHYSLLEALPKIPELVKKASLSGMKSLALTDSGNLYGAIEFYKECRDWGIKPIIGVDFSVAPRTRFDKEARIDNRTSNLTLLAENEIGYKNLLKLVTLSHLEGFYYRPRIDRELVEKHHDGLIAIAEEEKWYYEVFKDRFFLGINPRKSSITKLELPQKIQPVAVYDVFHLEPAERPIIDILAAIKGNIGRDRNFDRENDLSFRLPEEAENDFKDMPIAVENTYQIAERCNLELELGKWIFPILDLPRDTNPELELLRLANQGLALRNIKETPEVRERINYEHKIISEKGFAPYFLVVADLLRFAKEKGILSTTRGSAGGSFISYLIGITTINPLEYKLPFERFLNPERPKAPDIDVDFADNRRDEIIEYVKKKYGSDNVAQIGTFGTMMARGAVRDVARALGFSYSNGDRIAKLIPFGAQGFPMTIERALRENPDLKNLYDNDAEARTIIDTAMKIEGNARHISVHAAGVVISPKPLIEYTALQYDPRGEGKIITQYDMYSLTDEYGGVGLLKFDFLGIRNLSIIADTLERIEKIEGKKIKVEDIPLDDKKTFEMLARGETEATFQLNGDGMTRFLTELRPSTIHDINAMVALFRPGPMETIPTYIARKHNPKLISYLDPRMKEYLEFSYGLLVYQDDVLLTAIKLAGYSWLEADALRKAMGKKIPAVMEAERDKFINGAIKGGMTKEKAGELWDLIKPFAAYGFGKAHAASYGQVAYTTAYLKANFPEIYMSAVLTAESGNIETVGTMIAECRRMGIEVLPPSINESFSQFSVIKNERGGYKIRFGLTSIKNFGQGISSVITAERRAHGKFKDIADFLDRVRDRNLNKKSLEALIKSGALDEFGERGVLLANLDSLLEYHRERMRMPQNQETLFGLMTNTSSLPTLQMKQAEAASRKQKLAWEKELLGLYISGHPLEDYREKLEKREMNIKKLAGLRDGTETVIAGMIEEIRDVLTKNNEHMVFMRVCDLSGSTDVAVFPKTLEEFRHLIELENCVAIKGRISRRSKGESFIAEKIKAL